MPVIVTSVATARVHAAANAVLASAAAWLSVGTIAFRGPTGGRFGLLPLQPSSGLVAAGAAILIYVASLRNPRAASIALFPLALIVLPWLPGSIPPAFLIWTGAITAVVWVAVAIGLLAADRTRLDVRWLVSPQRACLAAAMAGCVIFGAAAHAASASIPGGDEPHYLIITQSLLYDHDLNIENNHARGDYRAYYGGPLNPDYAVRGRHGEIYSIHAPGIPLLVLPAFAAAGYRGVVVFLVLIASAACALAWWLAFQQTGSAGAAWFGWAAVACSAPFLLESFTVYPDGPGAAIVLTGFWALQRTTGLPPDGTRGSRSWIWTLHGAALACLPWMHTRFAVLAVCLGVLIVARLLRTPRAWRRVGAFLVVPLVAAAGWLAYFYVLYGSANPAVAYGADTNTSLRFLPDGIGGLLFDQGFGLLATAPVLGVGLAGLCWTRRFAAAWLLVAVPYAMAVASYAMWWAGVAGPGRFLVAILLPLAIPAAAAWKAASSRGARALMAGALVVSVWLSGMMAGGAGGMLGYHSRNAGGLTPAPWMPWANALVDLARATPAFVPLPTGSGLSARVDAARAGFGATIPWGLAVAALVACIVRAGRRRLVSPAALTASTAMAAATAAMAASSAVWAIHGGHPTTPFSSQMDALAALHDGRTIAIDLSSFRPLHTADALNMRIEVPVDSTDGSPATLATFAGLPAGRYIVSIRGALQGRAWLTAGTDDEPFVLQRGGAADFARGVQIDLPVTVRALELHADSAVRVTAVDLRPLSRDTASTAPAGARPAHHAARYGSTDVFFLDDRTQPEEGGFWIWGGRDGLVVFSPGGREQPITLRNGAAANQVTMRTGDVEQHFTLRPGEAQPVTVPASRGGQAVATVIRTSAGFRPSEVDSRSQDHRYLGVFIEMPEHASR